MVMHGTDDNEADVHARIAAAVHLLMEQRGISQNVLAKRLGLPASSLNRSINPDSTRPRPWRADEIHAMALFFNVPSSFFYDDSIVLEYESTHARIEHAWDEAVNRVMARLNAEQQTTVHA